jgi:hypothetical protein
MANANTITVPKTWLGSVFKQLLNKWASLLKVICDSGTMSMSRRMTLSGVESVVALEASYLQSISSLSGVDTLQIDPLEPLSCYFFPLEAVRAKCPHTIDPS